MSKEKLKVISKDQLKRVAEKVDFAKKGITKNCEGAECVLITHHVVKNGIITSYLDYSDFPNGDWGIVMEAIAIEARNAKLRAQTARSEK